MHTNELVVLMCILCVVCILACSSIQGARGVHGAHGIIKARWTLFPPPAPGAHPQSVRRGRIQERGESDTICMQAAFGAIPPPPRCPNRKRKPLGVANGRGQASHDRKGTLPSSPTLIERGKKAVPPLPVQERKKRRRPSCRPIGLTLVS